MIASLIRGVCVHKLQGGSPHFSLILPVATSSHSQAHFTHARCRYHL